MLHLYKFLFAETLWTSTNCAKLFLLIKSISIVMYTFIPLWGNLCRNSCLTLKCSQQTDKKIPLITCVGVKDVTFVDLTTNYTNDVIYGHCTGKKQMIRLFLVEQYWGFNRDFFSLVEFSQIIFTSNSYPTQNGGRRFHMSTRPRPNHFWKRRFHSGNPSNVLRPWYIAEDILVANNHGPFWICIWVKLG